MTRGLLFCAALGACAVVRGGVVIESARDIPVVQDVDVVVVGGTSAGVTAAVAAKQAGASVYLVAPRPYLGEDIAGTLRLALGPGETPETELAKEIWLDTAESLPFTYKAEAKSVAPHEDKGGLLNDGRTDDIVHGSVQFNVEKAKFNLQLDRPRYVESIELVSYVRKDDFAVGSARLVTSLDGKKWTPSQQLERLPSEGGQEHVRWRARIGREIRGVGLAAFRREDAKRMLLGEIVVRGKSDAPRVRVPTPIQVKQAFDRALLTNGVEFLTGSYVTDVLKDEKGAVAGVVIANRSGRQAVRARAVVDATERATTARLAGVPFTPYPKGPQTFTRIVISGEEPKAEGLTARTLPGAYDVGVQWSPKGRKVAGRAWACTLSIPMADGSFASFAEAEQIARDRTFTKAQLDAADTLFQVPPDRATGDVPHVFVLGGCAGLTAAQLRPLAFMAKGGEVGRRAAADAKGRTVPGAVTRPGDGARAAADGFEVREALNGLRPFDAGLPAVRSEAHALPVLGSYDVVVVGGGTGGAPAGIGAARKGAKTLLVEYLHGLGGVGTLGMIGKYWYGNAVGFTAEHDREVAALGAEVRACGKRETWRTENRRAGTTLWFGAMACGAVVSNGRVCGVVVATPQGRGVVLAGNVVDATGNSDVAAAAGARCRYVGAGEIALQGAGLSEKRLGSSYINSDWGYVNDSDAFDLALFSLRGRLGAGRVWDVSQVVETRERRSIVGAGTVTPLDILNHRTFPDTIVQGRSDFDSHGPSVDDVCYVSETVSNKVFWANMPYRSLIPEKLDGIAVAGIGISVHRDALPLLRMQPEVQNAGYAAGVAAAMACQSGKELRAVDVKALQRHLVDIGAIPAEVLDWTDNARADDETWLAAVKNLGDGYRNVHVVLADRERALPALRDAYAKATVPSAKLVYAHVLGILGDATGAETLARQIDGRDPAIRLNPKGLPAFGRRMSERDSFIVGLGRTKSPLAVQPLLAELAKVDGRTRGPTVRALALACEQMADPALAPALAAALKKDGISGWARPGAAAATPAGGFCSSPESGRCVRELNLARALLACGDHEGLARKTLEVYAQDGRGVFALHAREVLGAAR